MLAPSQLQTGYLGSDPMALPFLAMVLKGF